MHITTKNPLTGADLIQYIKENHLEDAPVVLGVEGYNTPIDDRGDEETLLVKAGNSLLICDECDYSDLVYELDRKALFDKPLTFEYSRPADEQTWDFMDRYAGEGGMSMDRLFALAEQDEVTLTFQLVVNDMQTAYDRAEDEHMDIVDTTKFSIDKETGEFLGVEVTYKRFPSIDEWVLQCNITKFTGDVTSVTSRRQIPLTENEYKQLDECLEKGLKNHKSIDRYVKENFPCLDEKMEEERE